VIKVFQQLLTRDGSDRKSQYHMIKHAFTILHDENDKTTLTKDPNRKKAFARDSCAQVKPKLHISLTLSDVTEMTAYRRSSCSFLSEINHVTERTDK